MAREINFLGLGFEAGQEKTGLSTSYHFARNYFSLLTSFGLKINDRGQVVSRLLYEKLTSFAQFEKYKWQDYETAFEKIKKLLYEKPLLLNWGGDHSIGISTVGAFTSVYPEGYVVWIDAHADLNLPNKSLTGNLHGMPVSILMDLDQIRESGLNWIQEKLLPQNLIYVGVRDLDPYEKQMIESLNIRLYSVQDIRNRGMESVAAEILELTSDHPLHISFDIDSLTPELAPSTGVPVPDGLNSDEIQTLAVTLSAHKNIRSLDIVEINPLLGDRMEVERTYQIALSFTRRILCKP